MPTIPHKLKPLPTLLLTLVAGSLPLTAADQVPSPLEIRVQGELTSVSASKGERLDLAITMANATGFPVEVTRAEVFLACQGGWAHSMGEWIEQGQGLFNQGRIINPGQYRFHYFYNDSQPVTHYLLALQLRWQDEPPHDFLLQVPLKRARFAAPPVLPARAPVFLTLQEPLEAVLLTSGELWLSIVGQVVNTSGQPLNLTKGSLSLRSDAGDAVLDRDLTPVWSIKNSKTSLEPFLFAFVLPAGFQKGTLELKARIKLRDEALSLTRQAEVTTAAPRLIRSPLDGAWLWSNSQGSLAFHSHYHYPEQRYCYDLLKLDPETRRTWRGDPNSNESFFAWNQPIYAVEDGKVLTVIQDVPDNLGQQENPANKPRRNSSILLGHAGGGFSLYNHARQGSATVKVGQKVKAGEVIGRVGNAGFSSEPHLHFGYMVLDRTGRVRNIPVRIAALKHADGRPADLAVPKSGEEYIATVDSPGG
jgi:hypothetical protein